MRGIGRRAVTDQFRQDRRPACLGMFERLEDDDAGPLTDDEAVAAGIEWAGGGRGVVVAGRQGAHRGETADERLEDAGLRAARDHDVGVAPADDLARLTQSMAAGGARRDHREVGSGHPELDRDHAGPGIRDAHRDEERADPVRAAQRVRGEPIRERADAAQTRPEDDPGPLCQLAFELCRQAGLVERLARRHESQLDVAVRASDLLAVQDPAGVEIVNLRSDP